MKLKQEMPLAWTVIDCYALIWGNWSLEKQKILIWAVLREFLIMWVLDYHGVNGLFIKEQLIRVQILPEQFNPDSFIKMKLSISIFLHPQAKNLSRCSWKCCSDQYLWLFFDTNLSKINMSSPSACFRSDQLILRT